MADKKDISTEHPVIQVLRQDRAKEDDQATASLKDYHTTITYLGAGALGFILTINEKFFPLHDGRFFYVLILCLTLLFLSLLLYVVTVLVDYYGHSRLRDTMDEDIQTIDFDSATQAERDAAEQRLLKQWSKIENWSRILMFSRLGLVVLGIGAEVIFMALNFSLTTKKDSPATIQIQVPTGTGHQTVIIDTSGKDNIHIQFQHP